MKANTFFYISTVAFIAAILLLIANEYADCSGQLVRTALWLACIL